MPQLGQECTVIGKNDGDAVTRAVLWRHLHRQQCLTFSPLARVLGAGIYSGAGELADFPGRAFQSGALPTTFVGRADTVVKQVEGCCEKVGSGVIDLFFQSSVVDDLQRVMQALELFGNEVLPRLREI